MEKPMRHASILVALLPALLLAFTGPGCGGKGDPPAAPDAPAGPEAAPLPDRPEGPPRDIGKVLFVQGEATVSGPGRGAGEKAVRDMLLTNRDTVCVAEGGRLTFRTLEAGGAKGFVMLKSGETKALWALEEGRDVMEVASRVLDHLTREEKTWVEDSAAAFTREYTPEVEGQPELLFPRATVRETRPAFEFRLPSEAARVTMALRAQGSKGMEDLLEMDVSKERHPFPKASPDLPRDRFIFCTLLAFDGDETQIGKFQTAFRVQDEEEAAEVEAWLKALDRLREGDPGAAALVESGYFYSRKLYADCVTAALRALARNPADAELEKGIDRVLGDTLKLTKAGASEFRARFAGASPGGGR
jgi:hypothetical protein